MTGGDVTDQTSKALAARAARVGAPTAPAATAPAPNAAASRSRGRRRTSHSLDSVVRAAVAILDEEGEPALTFRTLASRLGGGVASIYWYVSSKDELLGRAADSVLADILEDTADVGRGTDPLAETRALMMAFYRATASRPWLGAWFMRDAGTQPNGLVFYDRVGRQLMRLDLTVRQRFDAVSALMGYAVGVAADRGQDPPPEVRDGRVDLEDFVSQFRAEMRSSDADDFPFLRQIADEFAAHDDTEQFAAGLDLLLAGIGLQVGAGQAKGG